MAGNNKKPDHRHLRRAAEALSGRDDSTDVAVAVHLSEEIPFDCRVFPDMTSATTFTGQHSARAPWLVLECRTEDPELRSGPERGFFVVVHDETSPSHPLRPPCVDPRDIREMKLRLTLKNDQTVDINLTEHIAANHDKLQRPNPMIDAIFLSFEALDKYLFPNLVFTYGVNGANKLRESTKQTIEADANRYCKRKEDGQSWRLNV
jgi:hypothetical protein